MAPTGPRNPADDPETTTTQLYSLTFRFKGTRKPLVNQQKKYIALQRTSAQHQMCMAPYYATPLLAWRYPQLS